MRLILTLKPTPRRAFTLIELAVVTVVIGVLLALSIAPLREVRRQGQAVVCAANCRQLQVLVAAYTSDFKGYFPSWHSDVNVLPDTESRYMRQHYNAFNTDQWNTFAGMAVLAPVKYCPAQSVPRTLRTGYVLTAATLIAPIYLDPGLPRAQWESTSGARLQRLDDVVFPSDKVGVYEDRKWHRWRGSTGPMSSQGELFFSHPLWPGTAGYFDGHVEERYTSGTPYVDRYGVWVSSVYRTTPWGVWGRDRPVPPPTP